MTNGTHRHVAPLDVVRLEDGEMSAAEREALLEKAASCTLCEHVLKLTSGSLQQLDTMVAAQKDVPQEDAAAARLRAALDEAERPETVADLARRAWWKARSLRYVAAVLAVAGCVGFGMRLHALRDSLKESVLLPNRALTPGAVREVAMDDLCREGDDGNDLDPVVAVPTQRAVFREYGISAEALGKSFQMDYLINPQLGGSDDIRNLWPQPYSPVWNARAKDELERYLHRAVCERRMTLAEAQHEIAENWIDAYKRYFHRSQPI